MDNKETDQMQTEKLQEQENPNQEGSDAQDAKGQDKKLSKGQKKKLKQKKKKEQAKKLLQGETKTEQPQTNLQKPQQKVEVKPQIKPQAKQQIKQQDTKEPAQQGGKGKKDKKGKAPKMSAAAKMALQKIEKQKKFEQQQERRKREFEQEQQRLKKQQQERKRKEQEQKRLQQQERLKKKKEEMDKGLHMSKKQKEKIQKARAQLQHNQDHSKNAQQQMTQQEVQAIEKAKQQKKEKKFTGVLRDDRQFFQRKEGELRSPVCCILGHVDTGKTTLLDKIRNTNVQQGEAGGITQQIGATFFPQNKLVQQLKKCDSFRNIEATLPGLLIIDTPGHESFSNLRSRGSSLCDIAILVIDLMHGLEKQTIQSMQMLKKRNTPFVVALNKIDRCYGWKQIKDQSSYLQYQKQKTQTKHDFQTKLKLIITQLNEKGQNAALYWENQEPEQYISLIPTSGITGEGLPDLLSVIVENCLTRQCILKRIRVNPGKFNCTVMEVKVTEGYGTTIDCILVDGAIKKDDQIVLLGFNGPIISKVKAILTPHPMKQMRIKDEYLHHKFIHAANGVKIAANGLDQAVAGTPLIVANTPQQVQDAVVICQNQYENVKKKIKLQNMGVGVAASTLGSLQALLEYLGQQKIPVSHISVGPVSKDDVVKAMKSLLSQSPDRRKKQYACLLVFDVKILPDAQKYAQENEIKIFNANIIYHLTGFFNKYVTEIRQERRNRQGKQAIFPCILKQVATFRKSDPIVLGVDVEHGVLKVGTPLCVFRQNQKGQKHIRLGFVDSIQHNHKKIPEARKKTGSVAISLSGDSSIMSGRHFQQKDQLASMLTRRSIDCLKQHYRQEVLKEEWHLVVQLKKYFNII